MTITPRLQNAINLQLEANKMFDEQDRISDNMAKRLEKTFDLLTFEEVLYVHRNFIPKELDLHPWE